MKIEVGKFTKHETEERHSFFTKMRKTLLGICLSLLLLVMRIECTLARKRAIIMMKGERMGTTKLENGRIEKND